MKFKMADLFPIRKGDLCQVTEDANQYYRECMKVPHYNKTSWEVEGYVYPNHPHFGKTLIAMSEPYVNKKLVGHSSKYIDIYIQEDSSYDSVEVDELVRMTF